MPRRGRSASPPPAQRRQMASAPPPRHAAPAPAPQPRAVAPAPAPAPTAMAPPMAAPSAGGGMMANIASTAAGVAIGHTMGHAITGMFSGSGSDAPAPQQQQQAPVGQQPPAAFNTSEQSQGPCAWEVKQFLQCAQQQHDLTLCDGFNEAVRQCKSANQQF